MGLDLGGTTISTGLVTKTGEVIAKTSCKVTDLSEIGVVKQLAEQVREVCAVAKISMSEVKAIGLGSPGLLDVERGIVMSTANFPTWKDVALTEGVQKLTGLPVFLQGDAKCAVSAEAWVGVGSAKGVNKFYMLTVGTGIGGGAVVNGEVLMGFIEPGHMIVEKDGRECGCGQKGCLERYCSAAAVTREAKKAIANTKLPTLLSEKGDSVTCKDVFDAAEEGDTLAEQLLDECTYYLAIACLTISRVLAPEVIALSGGMTLAGNMLFDRIKHHLQKYNWKLADPVPVVSATLGNTAGFIGAAYVAIQREAALSTPKSKL